MRDHAAGANRAWLSILGVLLLLAGLSGLIIGTGLGTSFGMGLPGPGDTALPAAAGRWSGVPWVILVAAALGVLLALAGLAWLAAQIPRTHDAGALRVCDDAQTGLTKVDASVVTDALGRRIERLPGVSSASAVLRGTLERPDLTLRVTAGERTDIPALLATLQTRIADEMQQVLDAPLHRLGIEVDVDSGRTRNLDQITI